MRICFNPRAPCGARHPIRHLDLIAGVFQSTRPVRGATGRCKGCNHRCDVSIHAPRAGRDPSDKPLFSVFQSFNPRAPCGARLTVVIGIVISHWFQSTRPVRGATFVSATFSPASVFQSTRPVRGATPGGIRRYGGLRRFNPRAPCGARHVGRSPPLEDGEFQSTRPMRGATAKLCRLHHRSEVSIHAPHAGRDQGHPPSCTRCRRFNPRAPCGARHTSSIRRCRNSSFNPRAPCGARPAHVVHMVRITAVSIHAPHAGRDRRSTSPMYRTRRFNPRAPCGARHRRFHRVCLVKKFQSTRPMRGATYPRHDTGHSLGVSIHAPHAGRDGRAHPRKTRTQSFNPRAPCGARQQTRLRLPSFATYLWVLLATNMIFSAFCPTPLLRHGSHTYIFSLHFLFTSPSHSRRMLR